MSEESSLSYKRKEYKTNGLKIDGPYEGLEHIYDYETGGHHPVHLNDVLNKQYKVIDKLGNGGYANVWLCSDIASDDPRYVAVKILMAEVSTKDCPEMRVNKLIEIGLGDEGVFAEHFCLPLDQFEITGPNGLHYAFVYPVLGPRVSKLLHVSKLENPGKTLRSVCLQTTQAMATLHGHGICHGDFRPANILARVSGLDGLAEDIVLKALGEPKTTKVVTESGDMHKETTAPQYLVYPIRWHDVELNTLGANFISDKACVIDLGESYEISSPTPDLGIPQVYCSPEYTLDQKVGIGSDIWALGCTLFEIRTGRLLFDTFDDDKDEYLAKMAMILGKLPEPWWSSWEGREDFLKDETDASGRVMERWDYHPRDTSVVNHEEPKARSLQEAIAEGLFHENPYGPEGTHRDISQEEVSMFADLLGGILKYDPSERLTAQDVLKHAWFRL